VRKRSLERRACEQLGLLDRLDGPRAQAEPDESWLDGSLDAALEGLPSSESAALRLHILDDRPYDEVARELATTPGAARVRVHRGLARLRHRLMEEGEAS
jgi:RNA polymerase sigma-70 factor (ECF subfamily)